MKSQVWLKSQIMDIAAGLWAANDDPAFRAGVLSLCMSLDAMPERLPVVEVVNAAGEAMELPAGVRLVEVMQ